ncbi:hypothetical protein FOL47_009066 [Perkinsus chesapeaki]|uniref:Uncharacterized protein n=1 Tax=Perkinsus chesapeaki TaxID=330153 RepID=A0A7J6MTI9_PERCH|nr:hypothetical protein FOL47_009066 [Perkinsus chesapeaki]
MLSSAAAVAANQGLTNGDDSGLLLGSHKRRRINIESDSEDDSDSDDDKPIGVSNTALNSTTASPQPDAADEEVSSGVTTPTPPTNNIIKDESITPGKGAPTNPIDSTSTTPAAAVKSPSSTPMAASSSSPAADQTSTDEDDDDDGSSEDSDQPIMRRRRAAQRKVLKYTEDEESEGEDEDEDASDDESDDDEEEERESDDGSYSNDATTPARSAKARRRTRPKSASVKSEERGKKKAKGEGKVKREASATTPVAKKKVNRSEKEQLVSEVLCRWWYAMPPWPPANVDYVKELTKQGFRVVDLQDWEEEDDVDSQGRGKVYALSQFPGLYRAYDRRLIDVRPNEGKPSYNNLMRLSTDKLKALLREGIKNQLAELRAQPTFKRPGNGDQELEAELVVRGKRLGLKDGR